MSEQRLLVMKGVATSGKSTAAQHLAKQYDAVVLSSDEFAKPLSDGKGPNPIEAFQLLEKQAASLLKQGRSIIIDSTNLSKKRFRTWKLVAERFNIPIVCVFVNTTGQQLEDNIVNRSKEKWSFLPLETIKQKVHQMIVDMMVPTVLDNFDELIVVQSEPSFETQSYWRNYFIENETSFLDHPKAFMERLLENGELLSLFPEYKPMLEMRHFYGDMNLFEHMIIAADKLEEKRPELVWAMLLHELGKGCPRTKTHIGRFLTNCFTGIKGNTVPIQIVDGEYIYDGKVISKSDMFSDEQLHFFGYETYSAMFAYEMLHRIGYPLPFIIKVATLVQLHRKLVHHIDEERELYLKGLYGEDIFNDLYLMKKADYVS